MFARFLVVLGQVSTLFLMMGVGYVLGKWKKITAAGTGEMSSLLLYVVAPCIIIDSFQTDYDPSLLRTLAVGALVELVFFFLYAMIVKLFFRREDDDTRISFRFGSMYGNTGFMGLPLIQAIMGDEALIFAVVSLMVFNVVVWSHGYMMMNGSAKGFSLKNVLLTPGILAVVIGLPLFLAQLTLPGVLHTAVKYIGSMNTPLAMVVIGAQMARADLGALLRDKKLFEASALKLILIPIFTAVVLLPLRHNALLYTATVILSGAPTAGITSMFAERFDRAPERAAGLVSLSTLLSILTLPIIAVAAEAIAG